MFSIRKCKKEEDTTNGKKITFKRVQVSNDQERAQSERNPHSTNRGVQTFFSASLLIIRIYLNSPKI